MNKQNLFKGTAPTFTKYLVMSKMLICNCLFFTIVLTIVSCSSAYSEAKEMGLQWCKCNESMDSLYMALYSIDKQQNKDEISVKILAEQTKVIECMGGEEKLRQLNEKFSGTAFQKFYDQARVENCSDRVKLLSKKGN